MRLQPPYIDLDWPCLEHVDMVFPKTGPFRHRPIYSQIRDQAMIWAQLGRVGSTNYLLVWLSKDQRRNANLPTWPDARPVPLRLGIVTLEVFSCATGPVTDSLHDLL